MAAHGGAPLQKGGRAEGTAHSEVPMASHRSPGLAAGDSSSFFDALPLTAFDVAKELCYNPGKPELDGFLRQS